MKESPWADYLFLRQWQYAWCMYLARLQSTIIGELDAPIQKAGHLLNMLGAIMSEFSDKLSARPRYDGHKTIRIGTPAAAGDLKKVDQDVHKFLEANWNKVYRSATYRGTALGMIAGELQRRGYDLNRLKNMSIDDVDGAMKAEGHDGGLAKVDEWLESTRAVKKQSLYSQAWAEAEGARWLATYDEKGNRAGRPYEVVTKMYRDVIAESVYRNEPFDKLRHRLVFAGNDLAIEQATLQDGTIDEVSYQAFIEKHLNRDFLRLARTETAINFNNGRLLWQLHESDGSPQYVVFTGGAGGNSKDSKMCSFCEGWQSAAAVCRLFESQSAFEESPFYGGDDLIINDDVAQFAIWPGKNNVDRSFADWWICCPVHPNCSHIWTPFTPRERDREAEEDDAAIDEIFGQFADRDDRRRGRLAGQLETSKRRNRRMIAKEKALRFSGPWAVAGLTLLPTCAHEDEADDWTREYLRE